MAGQAHQIVAQQSTQGPVEPCPDLMIANTVSHSTFLQTSPFEDQIHPRSIAACTSLTSTRVLRQATLAHRPKNLTFCLVLRHLLLTDGLVLVKATPRARHCHLAFSSDRWICFWCEGLMVASFATALAAIDSTKESLLDLWQ
jgi:hypothetical protein